MLVDNPCEVKRSSRCAGILGELSALRKLTGSPTSVVGKSPSRSMTDSVQAAPCFRQLPVNFRKAFYPSRMHLRRSATAGHSVHAHARPDGATAPLRNVYDASGHALHAPSRTSLRRKSFAFLDSHNDRQQVFAVFDNILQEYCIGREECLII